MARFVLLFCFFAFTASLTSAQNTPDFIRIKKKSGRTIKTIMPGVYVWITANNGYHLEGEIKDIRRDSVYLKQYSIETFYTPWFTKEYDTLAQYALPIYYKDIKRIEYTQHRPAARLSNLAASILQIGGAGYTVLNVVNGLSKGAHVFRGDNLTSLGIATSAFVLGTAIKRRSNPSFTKKQKLEYVNMQ